MSKKNFDKNYNSKMASNKKSNGQPSSTHEKRKKIIRDLVNDPLYVPMKEKELAIFLQVNPEDREELSKILKELLEENELQISKRGKYQKGSSNVVVGTFISNAKGFGFVEIEGEKEDYFIPAEFVNGAFHKDLVEIVPEKKQTQGKRKEARIIKIVEHTLTKVVGTFQKSKNFGFVVPDDNKIMSDIFVPIERSKGAMDGHKVVVEITDYGKNNKKPEGKVIEIIGHISDPGVDIISVVRALDIPMEFPEKVMNQAEKVPTEISEADMLGREDLRDWQMVTIDGEDAKDLDDAVSLTIKDGMYELGVHIADVANYVQEGSALDREALKRGTSVYLADRVIPMLPRRLSNGICSLNAHEDRLAMSCIMTMDHNGNVTDYRIVESVIHVNERMSYTSVKKILEDNDEAEIEKYEALVPMFKDMEKLSSILRNKRKERGSIDFDMPECKIIVDANGRPTEIKPYEANTATKLIESFMLAANETVAGHMFWQDMPFLYRIHEAPDMERIEKLSHIIQSFGLFIKGSKEEIHPKEIQKLLVSIEGRPEENLVTRLALRSMMRAKYSTECLGHFGLACKEYSHFTSPIRRYPDLQIHRILKDQIRNRLNENRITHYKNILDQVAQDTSKLERRAEEAERETDKLKKVQYMEEHIGEAFEGVVSGVTNYGLYVELPNTVEGMIHISKIEGDYYYYNEASYELIGEATGRKYRLGQTVNVIVDSVDAAMKTIEFVFS